MTTDDQIPMDQMAEDIAREGLTRWGKSLAARGHRQRSTSRQLRGVESFLMHSGKLPWNVTERDFFEWATYLIQVRGLRGVSVRGSLDAVCRFLKYLSNDRDFAEELRERLGTIPPRFENISRLRILEGWLPAKYPLIKNALERNVVEAADND